MAQGTEILAIDNVQNMIFTVRNIQIMLDRDLAELYQVDTKVLNQAVKRNMARFPESFRFQLNDSEKNELVTNCDRFSRLKHATVNPYAFIERTIADKPQSRLQKYRLTPMGKAILEGRA